MICFAAVDWWYHNRAHSEVQLMLRLARSQPVLFVNSIGMRVPLPGKTSNAGRRIARKLASVAKTMQTPVPSLPDFHVMTTASLPVYGNRALRELNASSVRWQVQHAMRSIGVTDPAIVVTVPTAWDVVRPMARTVLICNRSDKHSAFAETNQESIADFEARLLQNSDRVMYASRNLMLEEAPIVGDRAVFLDHGVDLEHFRATPPSQEPADLAAIPHPRIGFFGGLDDYTVDFDLLGRVAREIPNAQLVLIGDSTVDMRPLEDLPNVHWLGYRPYEEIPRYGSGFDVALMPWLRNEWIAASNPIKLKEYLALGLPIVSTDFPEAHRYADHLTIARDADDFVHSIAARLADGGPGSPADRRAAVERDSWDRRAEELAAMLAAPAVR